MAPTTHPATPPAITVGLLCPRNFKTTTTTTVTSIEIITNVINAFEFITLNLELEKIYLL